MPRRLALLVLLVPTLIAICACGSDSDSPTAPGPSGEYIWVHLEQDSTQVFLNTLPSVDIDGAAAVHLDHLVSTTLIPMYEAQNDSVYDARVLYGYLFMGDDGFSPHTRGYPSNTWEQMPLGYIIVATRRVVFPDEAIDLPGAYNVKDTGHLHIRRKFDVVAADTSAFFELADMPVVQIPNFQEELEDAVGLADFVAALVEDPSANTFHLTALDGFGTSDALTWEQLQTGYWLLATKRTRFTDSALTDGQYRVRMLERITVQ